MSPGYNKIMVKVTSLDCGHEGFLAICQKIFVSTDRSYWLHPWRHADIWPVRANGWHSSCSWVLLQYQTPMLNWWCKVNVPYLKMSPTKDYSWRSTKYFYLQQQSYSYTSIQMCSGCTIDYRCADGRFLMSPSDVAISNQYYLSSSETRVKGTQNSSFLLLQNIEKALRRGAEGFKYFLESFENQQNTVV